MFFHNITDIMTDKPRHLLKWNFLFLLIKHMKGKKKSPVKSSFNKEACAANRGKTGLVHRQKIHSLQILIFRILYLGGKKLKSLKSKKTKITVSLSFGPVVPEPSVEKRGTQ